MGFCQPCAQEKEEQPLKRQVSNNSSKSSDGTKGRMERKLEKMTLPQAYAALDDSEKAYATSAHGGHDDDTGRASNGSSKVSDGTKGRMERKLEKMALPQVYAAQGRNDEGTASSDSHSSRSSEGRDEVQQPRSSSFHGTSEEPYRP